MSKLRRSKIIKLMGCVVLIAALLIGENWLYRNRTVHFEDDKMRQVICLELGKDKNSQNVTYKELEKIEELRIGPVGEFETIIDVAKCKNLKRLLVNVEITERDAYYNLFQKTKDGKIYYPPIDEQRKDIIQDDLEKILKKVKGIEEFRFTNVNETCNIGNIDFLEHAKNIKEIDMVFVNVRDYSGLKNCSKVETVDLSESNIGTADILLKLNKLSKLVLINTPLAENEEEINRLKEAFPQAKIIVD